MWIRYKVLQTAVAFLVALGSVALGGTWAWAQQEEGNPSAQQNCPGAEELGTVGPDDRDVVVEFDTEGDKFRVTYKTTNLDESGGPFLDVTILNEDGDEVNALVIRDQGTQTEIIPEGPGTFTMEIRAQDLTYEITVDDCTGNDGSGGNGGSNDRNRNNHRNRNNDRDRHSHHNRHSHNNRSSGLDRSPVSGQYGRSLDVNDGLGLGENLTFGDNPGFGIGQDANIPEDVIADTVPDRRLPFTGGPPLFGLALIGLACAGIGITVLRSAIRR